jgi:hypothetical protein
MQLNPHRKNSKKNQKTFAQSKKVVSLQSVFWGRKREKEMTEE